MKLEDICKIYKTSKNEVTALKNITLEFNMGKMYAIMGRSGSGKTTLINILGLLDEPTSGKYYFEDKDTKGFNDNDKSNIRNKEIGFIFQSYYLEDNLTALENVILPSLKNKKLTNEERIQRAKELLDQFGLNNRYNHKPSELSGGEQQRVAIARSLMNNPNYIIADEPTGNLDEENEKDVFEYLKNISRQGKCVIVVSHEEAIKQYCDELYNLKNGVLDE